MQELYFQQLRNRDVGPFSANQIRQMIRSGRIQSSDKIRIGGEAIAYQASEILAFREEIEQIAAQETNGRRWVCMRARQMTKGSTSAMCGPYTRGEIVNMLLRNELMPADYVWREGFTAWKTLESVAQLQLPIPSFPRITWNRATLDWNPQKALPQAHASPAPKTSRLADLALDAAIAVVCGLFALIVWKLAFHHPNPRKIVKRAAAPRVTAPAARPKRPALRAPTPPKAKSVTT